MSTLSLDLGLERLTRPLQEGSGSDKIIVSYSGYSPCSIAESILFRGSGKG